VVAEIRDPVHGYIHIDDVEREIIDNPIFQRLRRIRQLSGAFLTYPGAQHTRFEHLIGSMHLAGLAAEKLRSKAGLTDHDVREIRLAALVHDIGHGPFSHLFEEVMAERHGLSHEDITKRILKETDLRDVVEEYGFDIEVIPDFAIGLSKDRPPFMNELVGGGLSVDSMDYLLRDSYFTGVEYGRVDVQRLIDSFEVVEGRLAVDQAALYALEALMIARYEMFRAVYFHRTVRAAEIMLIRAIKLADEALNLTDTSDLSRYLSLTDEVVLGLLTDLKPEGRSGLKEAKQLALDYRDRRLMKCVFEKFFQRGDRLIDRLFSSKRVRDQMVVEIAEAADVNPEKVYVDVPTAPSVPFTSSRQMLTTLTLTSRSPSGFEHQTLDIRDLPLIGAISGYMDILRIYTDRRFRETVERAAVKLLGEGRV